jgi:hypothetical protein
VGAAKELLSSLKRRACTSIKRIVKLVLGDLALAAIYGLSPLFTLNESHHRLFVGDLDQYCAGRNLGHSGEEAVSA